MTDFVPKLLDKGVGLHRAGKLGEAEAHYDKVLQIEPTNADALNLKGILANGAGKYTQAATLFDRAIAARPNFPEGFFNKALALTAAGRNSDALQCYQHAIALQPDYADARVNSGLLLFTMGKREEAIAVFRAMTDACPSDARGFYNLGICFEKSLEQAAADEHGLIAIQAGEALDRAATLDPGNADVHFARGNLYMRLGEHNAATHRFDAALRLRPEWASALSALAAAQLHLDDIARATQNAQRAVQLEPGHAYAHGILAEAMLRIGAVDDALSHFETRLKHEPTDSATLSNYGLALLRAGRAAEAFAAYQQALSYRANAEARYGLGLAALTLGRLEDGWKHYEARHELGQGRLGLRSRERSPLPPPGAKLIAVNEQGLGEQIMFASFISDLLEWSGDLDVHCDPRLKSLFERSFPAARFTPRAMKSGPSNLRAVSLADAGQWLRPDFAHFPSHTGYLRADPALTTELRARYRADGSTFLIGISWATRANAKLGEAKSIPLREWGPILSVPGATFVNLQYDASSTEIAEAAEAHGARIICDDSIDASTDLDRFAAQVAAVDLVITTSNTTAHMGGALSVPTWIMLPRGTGSLWHWFLDRDDSPWYPSVRLFRQPTRGDWRSVLKEVSTALADRLNRSC